MRKKKLFIDEYPELVNEWDFSKNESVDIKKITYGSAKDISWVCKYNHNWNEKLKKRTLRGDGCPFCSGKRSIKGENDFATVFPDLLSEWDYKKNVNTPDEYLPFSNEKVFWVCKKGHSFPARISDRSKGKGCPYCAGKRAYSGENDLFTIYPELEKKWDYERNTDLNPNELTVGSSKLAIWKCDHCHRWERRIKNMVKHPDCPFCSGIKVLSGENDLGMLYPELIKEWNAKKNIKNYDEYFPNSNKEVWWICENGHEWPEKIYLRVKGYECPFCSGKRPIIGVNDLKTKQPELVMEWNYDRNLWKKPEDYLEFSNEKVWWICKNGHEWRAEIYHRSMGTGCKKCNSFENK